MPKHWGGGGWFGSTLALQWHHHTRADMQSGGCVSEVVVVVVYISMKSPSLSAAGVSVVMPHFISHLMSRSRGYHHKGDLMLESRDPQLCPFVVQFSWERNTNKFGEKRK